MTDDRPVTSGDHTDAVDRDAVARHAVDPDTIESAGAAARQSAPGDARRAGPLPATSDNAGTPFDVSRSRRIAIRIGLLGPAFVAAVAYVDPGNVAANLQAGARYGYLLVWVLVVATASAGVVQYLSAKLGLATGESLPELVGAAARAAGPAGLLVAGRRPSRWPPTSPR